MQMVPVERLRLVGTMLLGVTSAGGAKGQLGHLLLVLLLDFPVPMHRKGPPLLEPQNLAILGQNRSRLLFKNFEKQSKHLEQHLEVGRSAYVGMVSTKFPERLASEVKSACKLLAVQRTAKYTDVQ